MNRFFLHPDQIRDDKVSFPPDISHQILHVLRLSEGELVEVLDNQGHLFHVSLEITPSQGNLNGKITAVEASSEEPKTQVSLCFGMSNREKVEWILQKGTEIGVAAFYPFISSRTLVQSTSLSANREERWVRIIREAAEQSRRWRLPILNLPENFEQVLEKSLRSHALCLIAWEDAENNPLALKRCVQEYQGASIAVFVGPEGGFSEDEINLARKTGCQVISLGKRILRMETAAILFPALVLHDMGEL